MAETPVSESRLNRRRASAKSEAGPAYEQRKDEFRQAAVRIFRRMGYRAAKVSDIAREAGTDRATFYYYYVNKQEVFQELVATAVEQNVREAERIAEQPGSAGDCLRCLVLALMGSFEANYPHLYVFVQEDMSTWSRSAKSTAAMETLNRRYEGAVHSILQRGVDSGEFRPVSSVKVLVHGLIGMVSWTHRWYDPAGTLTASEIAAAFSELYINGISAEPHVG